MSCLEYADNVCQRPDAAGLQEKSIGPPIAERGGDGIELTEIKKLFQRLE